MSSAIKKAKSRKDHTKHDLVGRDVLYNGDLWVVVEVSGESDPWFTLRRSTLEIIAKEYELQEVWD